MRRNREKVKLCFFLILNTCSITPHSRGVFRVIDKRIPVTLDMVDGVVPVNLLL